MPQGIESDNSSGITRNQEGGSNVFSAAVDALSKLDISTSSPSSLASISDKMEKPAAQPNKKQKMEETGRSKELQESPFVGSNSGAGKVREDSTKSAFTQITVKERYLSGVPSREVGQEWSPTLSAVFKAANEKQLQHESLGGGAQSQGVQTTPTTSPSTDSARSATLKGLLHIGSPSPQLAPRDGGAQLPATSPLLPTPGMPEAVRKLLRPPRGGQPFTPRVGTSPYNPYQHVVFPGYTQPQSPWRGQPHLTPLCLLNVNMHVCDMQLLFMCHVGNLPIYQAHPYGHLPIE